MLPEWQTCYWRFGKLTTFEWHILGRLGLSSGSRCTQKANPVKLMGPKVPLS